MISKMLKRILCLTMCFIMCGSMTAIAFDVDSDGAGNVAPVYTNIASKSCSLVISGINSTSSASLHSSKSMSLKIKMELQKKKSGVYQTIETWTDSRPGTILTMEKGRLINVLADYRLKVTFTAGSETAVSYAYPS